MKWRETREQMASWHAEMEATVQAAATRRAALVECDGAVVKVSDVAFDFGPNVEAAHRLAETLRHTTALTITTGGAAS